MELNLGFQHSFLPEMIRQQSENLKFRGDFKIPLRVLKSSQEEEGLRGQNFKRETESLKILSLIMTIMMNPF